MHYCPTCNVRVNPNKAYAKIAYQHQLYYLCCPLCQSEFEKEPEKYLKQSKKKRRRG